MPKRQFGTRSLERIYALLKQMGSGWHGRSELADWLDRPRLNDADVGALNELVRQERIEQRILPSAHSVMMQRYEYRILESEEKTTGVSKDT